MEKFYIYKITLVSGATYVGSHIQKKENDSYSNSSSYIRNNPEDKILKREILLYLPTSEQMDIMETICIMEDKCYSKHNVNGNYGNWYYHFCGGRAFKGLPISEEHREKLKPYFFKKGRKLPEKDKQHLKQLYSKKIICLETNKLYFSCKEAGKNSNRSAKSKGLLSANKKHYLFLEDFLKLEISCDDYLSIIKTLNQLKVSRPVICLETNEFFISIKEASQKKKVYDIQDCLSNRYETAGKFHWEYVSKEKYLKNNLSEKDWKGLAKLGLIQNGKILYL